MSDFGDLMNQVCTHYVAGSMNVRAEIQYSAGVNVRCRIERLARRVLTFDGRESIASGTVYIDQDYATLIAPRDKIVLDDGSQPQILRVESMPDLDGSRYYQAVDFA